jgi:hypothetical protein
MSQPLDTTIRKARQTFAAPKIPGWVGNIREEAVGEDTSGEKFKIQEGLSCLK